MDMLSVTKVGQQFGYETAGTAAYSAGETAGTAAFTQGSETAGSVACSAPSSSSSFCAVG